MTIQRFGLSIIALVYFIAVPVSRGDLWISEFMAENGEGLQSADGAFHGWIEIYNDGDADVSLAGYYLTDDRKELSKWAFPVRTTIGPRDFQLVFASGSDSVNPSELHTNFQLKDSGEYLGLIAPDGIQVLHDFGKAYPEQHPNVAFGLASAGPRKEVNREEAGFLKFATPGEANTIVLEGFVKRVFLSEEHGYKSAPFALAMESTTPESVIRYTLDGSEPNPISGKEYHEPVTIDSTSVVRARAFRQGYLPSPVITQTYLFLEDVVRQSPNGEAPPGWPRNYVNDQMLDYGMDPDIVGGEHTVKEVVESLASLPSLSVSTSMENMFDAERGIYVNAGYRGREWERPASFELITGSEERSFQVNAGLRIRGGYSRDGRNPKHAMRLIFRKTYGSGKLKFPLFGEEGTQEFDHIDLRTSLNHSWAFGGSQANTMLRDVFCRDTQRDMGQPYTRSRYYHLYLNGVYWGIYMTQERAMGPYAASYMGGNADDYDVVKTRGQLAAGSWDAHNDYFALASEGFSDDENYFRVQGLNPDGTNNPNYPKYLDVDNVIDYMVLTYYVRNSDGPGGGFTPFPNNFYAVFNRENPDGWKYFAHDMEHTFDVGRLEVRNTNKGWSREWFNVHGLHERLVENPHYLKRFRKRTSEHLFGDGALSTKNSMARLAQRQATIDRAIIAHSARWGDADPRRRSRSFTRQDWLRAVGRLHDFVSGRSEELVEEFVRVGWYDGVKPPEVIEGNENLYIASTGGTIYYTTDGADPRGADGAPITDAGIAEPPTKKRLLLVDRQTPLSAWPAVHGRHDDKWFLADFDDREWMQGLPGVGYDDDGDYIDANLINLNLARTMFGKTNSIYIRIPFQATDIGSFEFVDFEMMADDGFVAYLNGQPLAAFGAPSKLTWESASSEKPNDAEATTFRKFRLRKSQARAMAEGSNLLAIHGLNVSKDSSDLIMIPRLSATRITGGTPIRRRGEIRARVLEDGDWSPLAEWP